MSKPTKKAKAAPVEKMTDAIVEDKKVAPKKVAAKKAAAPVVEEKKPVAAKKAAEEKPAPVAVEEKKPAAAKKTATKKAAAAPVVEEKPAPVVEQKKPVATKKAPATKKAAPAPKPTMTDDDDEANEEEELMDLLKEFEEEQTTAPKKSSAKVTQMNKKEEEEAEKKFSADAIRAEMAKLKDIVGDAQYNKIMKLNTLSNKKQPSADVKKAQAAEKAQITLQKEQYIAERAKPHVKGGVIYLGHLPTGMTETVAKRFFKQFGEVKRVMFSRSKFTGNYRGYGFMEFSNPETAMIVADSMNGYMLFGRVLQCQYIPYEQLHPMTFRNAYREFKVQNFTDVHNAKLIRRNQSKTTQQVEEKSRADISRITKKQKKLDALGIKYDVSDVIYQGDEQIVVDRLPKKAKAQEEKAVDATKLVQLPKASAQSAVAKKAAKKAAAEVVSEAAPTTNAAAKKRVAATQQVPEEPKVEEKPVAKKAAAGKKAAVAAPVVEEKKEEPKVEEKKPVAAKKTATKKAAAAPVVEEKPAPVVEEKKPVATKKTAAGKKAVVEEKPAPVVVEEKKPVAKKTATKKAATKQ